MLLQQVCFCVIINLNTGGKIMVEAKDIAFQLHEEWRKTLVGLDGKCEPMWVEVKDRDFIMHYFRTDHYSFIRDGRKNGVEIDVANCCFNRLSPDLQVKILEAAEVVVDILNRRRVGEIITDEQAGAIIHKAWLVRNNEYLGQLDVPFVKLPLVEQHKRLRQLKIGETMDKAIEIRPGADIEKCVQLLQDHKQNHQSVYIDFNGKKMYSEFDDETACYFKACGMSKHEFHNRINKFIKDIESSTKFEK